MPLRYNKHILEKRKRFSKMCLLNRFEASRLAACTYDITSGAVPLAETIAGIFGSRVIYLVPSGGILQYNLRIHIGMKKAAPKSIGAAFYNSSCNRRSE